MLNGSKGCPVPDMTNDEKPPRWPLSFQSSYDPHAIDKQHNASQQSSQQPLFWTHSFYEGPQGQPPRILYSRTKGESEEIAQEFLGEEILGFDMEWPPFESEQRQRLQDKIGLIQIASESKIALFHIGLHNGNTTQDIIAPSLRRIIESPSIVKLGVNIVNADFSRLRQHFGLDPKGAFELSHLYSLVNLGPNRPEPLTTRLVKLSRQVEDVLGLPLSKDKAVRCSNWSQPLGIDQMEYAADDAYAGLMIYHCLNARRAALVPSPPLPVLADHYGQRLPSSSALCLQAPVTASEFFRRSNCREVSVHNPKEAKLPSASRSGHELDNPSSAKGEVKVITFSGQGGNGTVKLSKMHVKRKVEDVGHEGPQAPRTPEDKGHDQLEGLDLVLYDRLVQCRREFAAKQDLPLYLVAHNTHLKEMARSRPLNLESLQLINGIGPRKAEQYGGGWIRVIGEFLRENGGQLSASPTVSRGVKRRVALSTPHYQEPRSTPNIHTGLSFSMEQTTISQQLGSGDESESSKFGSPMRTPTTSRVKRSRSQNDQREGSPTRTQRKPEPSTPGTMQQSSQLGNMSYQTPQAPSLSLQSSQASKPQARQPEEPHSQRHSLQNKNPVYHNSQSTPHPQRATPNSQTTSPVASESHVFEKKLLAFSKQITSKLLSKPSTPILSDATAHQIAMNPPMSNQELLKIPGAITLVRACAEAQVNLLDIIAKWKPDPNSAWKGSQ
ncbi:putative HRDC domain-containing protein [Seiridium cardinale]